MLSQIGFPGRSKPVKGKEGSRMDLREERSFSREDLSQPGRDLWPITEPEWLSFCTTQLWTQAVRVRRGCGKSWPSIAEKSTQLQSACWYSFHHRQQVLPWRARQHISSSTTRRTLLKLICLFLLHWTFVATHRPSVVAESRVRSLVSVLRRLTAVASLVADHGALGCAGFSSCSSWALECGLSSCGTQA